MSWLDEAYRDFKNAYDAYEQVNSYSDYYDLANDLVNEDTRQGTLFKEAVKRTVDIAGKLVGNSALSEHPYFAYHKVHLEALATALNTRAVHNAAEKALAAAGKIAQRVQIVANLCDKYAERRADNVRYYDDWLYEILSDLKELRRTGVIKDRLVDGKMPDDELASLPEETRFALKNYREWLKKLDLLVRDTFALLIMVRIEANQVEKLMSVYNQKRDTLASQEGGFGRNIGQVAERSLERDRQYAILEAERARIHGKPQARQLDAMAKPLETVRRALERVEQEAKKAAACASIGANNSAIEYPMQATSQLASLQTR